MADNGEWQIMGNDRQWEITFVFDRQRWITDNGEWHTMMINSQW